MFLGDTYNAPVNIKKYGPNAQINKSGDVYHGKVDRSTHTTTYGNNAQVGVSHKVYHGTVDKSVNKTTYGDHAQIGGVRSIGGGKLSAANKQNLCYSRYTIRERVNFKA